MSAYRSKKLVGNYIVSRLPGVATQSVIVRLPADQDLSVVVKAYRESQPDATGSIPIAQGTLTGLSFRSGLVTTASLHLEALFAPQVTAMSNNWGQIGDTVLLSGANFNQGAAPLVEFQGGALATGSIIDAEHFSAVVPGGALPGLLRVWADGVPSEKQVYWLLSAKLPAISKVALSINPQRQTWDETSGTAYQVMVGRQLSVKPKLEVWAPTDVATPTVSLEIDPFWEVSNSLAGKITFFGPFYAGPQDADSRVTARIGSLRSTPIEVRVRTFSFSLRPATLSIDLTSDPLDGWQFEAVLTSDGATISGANYTSSAPAAFAISASGVGRVLDATAPRELTVTAASPVDPTIKAVATVSLVTAQVSTLAGSSTSGFMDGTGAAALFNYPYGVAVNATGNVFVADSSNHRIRKISPAGAVTTLAGSSASGYMDATGAAALFNYPQGVAVDAAGDVFVADSNNHRIRKISPAGAVTTLAGSGFSGLQDGTGTAARFNYPRVVAVDATGNVFVADAGNHAIRKVSPAGTVTTVAGSGNAGFLDGTGTAARFNYPYGVAVDATGNVFVADAGNNRIRKISPVGAVTTLAGSSTSGFMDGAAAAARFNNPRGVAVDATGNVFVADSDNWRIRKITVPK